MTITATIATLSSSADPEQLATAVADGDRSAILLWLRHSTSPTRAGRRRLAYGILCGSVFTQARLLGLVECGHCGDVGCEVCTPTGRAFPW